MSKKKPCWVPPPCKTTASPVQQEPFDKEKEIRTIHKLHQRISENENIPICTWDGSTQNLFVQSQQYFESDYAELLKALSSYKLQLYENLDEIQNLKQNLQNKEEKIAKLQSELTFEKKEIKNAKDTNKLLADLVDKYEALTLAHNNNGKQAKDQDSIDSRHISVIKVIDRGESPINLQSEFSWKSTQFSPTPTKTQFVQKFFNEITTIDKESQTDGGKMRHEKIQTDWNHEPAMKEHSKYLKKHKSKSRKRSDFTNVPEDDLSVNVQEQLEKSRKDKEEESQKENETLKAYIHFLKESFQVVFSEADSQNSN